MGRNLTGGSYSAASVPQWPIGKDPYAWTSSLANYGQSSCVLPSLLNDGSYLNVGSGQVTLYNSQNTAIWTKAPTDVNASANAMMPVAWVDATDGAIYLIATGTGMAYPFKITLSTGILTALGTGFSTANTQITSFSYLSRASQGAGDFTLFGAGGVSSPSGSPVSLNFSSANGAITKAISNVKNSLSSLGTVGTNPAAISYRSQDGTIIAGLGLYYMNQGVSPILLILHRNGKSAIFAPQGSSSYNGCAVPTGSALTVVGSSVLCTGGLVQQGQIPMMSRADFDAFLAAACTYMGI